MGPDRQEAEDKRPNGKHPDDHFAQQNGNKKTEEKPGCPFIIPSSGLTKLRSINYHPPP
jgi:hypothetical protein